MSQIGPNIGKFSKCFSTTPKACFKKKMMQIFKFFLKRHLTRFWWITGKYCKYKKIQIGPDTWKFSKCFYYKRLSTAPKASFFENNKSFKKKKKNYKDVLQAFDE